MGNPHGAIFSPNLFTNATTDDRSVKVDTSKIKGTKEIKDACFNKGEEIMSPEGVEEKVEMGLSFVVTLTQGCKYRLYAVNNPCGSTKCQKPYHEPVSIGLRDTRQEMLMLLGMTCMHEGALLARAELIMGTLDDFFKRGDGEDK